MGYTQFTINNIILRYFPDQKALLMVPQRNTKKNDLVALKNKLETFLQITSTKTQKDGISLKLNQNAPDNINELLKSMGAQGGEEIEDASSIAAEPAEEETEEQKNLNPPMAPQQQNPQQPMMDPNQQQMPQENFSYGKMYDFFYESMFGEKKRQKSKRLGQYWEILEKNISKKRMKIDEKDVLMLRTKVSKKLPNEERNEVLRALDSASKFFFRNLEKERGFQAAQNFMDEYKSVDNLSPNEYSDDPTNKPNPEEIKFGIDNNSNLTPGNDDGSINGPNFNDLKDFLNTDEESYEDIEVEEETS